MEIQLGGEQRHQLVKRPTENAEAYQLYLKGRFFWNKYNSEGWRKALDYFRQASEKDPNYSLAYAGMADCYAVLSGIEFRPREAMPKAKATANRALGIDANLAEAHTSLAFVNLRYEYDWPAAEKEFQQAIQLDPHYATAHRWYFFYLAAMGRVEEGIQEMRRAQELEPLSLIIGTNLGAAYLFARRYDEAIAELQKTLEMNPDFFPALGWIGLAYQKKGMHEQSVSSLQRYSQLDSSTRGLAQLGQAYAAAGRKAEAKKVLEELRRLSGERVVPPYHVAAIYAALGDNDQAFEWLEKAYKEKSEYLIWIKVHPTMDNLRSDPRFQDLLREMKLVS